LATPALWLPSFNNHYFSLSRKQTIFFSIESRKPSGMKITKYLNRNYIY
jgi:hypothetical protein